MAIRLNHSWRDGIILIIADRLDLPSQAKSPLHSLEQFTHGTAVGGDLHLHATIAIEVDNGVGLPSAIEDVLGDVQGSGVAFGAEAAAFAVDFVGMGALEAAGGVAGEGFHDVELVVVGEARVGCWDGGEADLARGGGRHGGRFAFASFQNWLWFW